MAKSAATLDLHKGDKVVAAVDLRGVPQGTAGKVAIVNGLSWRRYWVRFTNDVAIGSLDRSKLARPDEWERKLAGGGDEVDAGAGDAAADSDGAAADAGAGGGGFTTPSGTVVPQKLIDRTKAARARLGV